jgi:hypothetical protein
LQIITFSRFVLLGIASVTMYAQAADVSNADYAHSIKVKNMPETGYTNEYRKEKPLRLPHGILGNQNQPDRAEQTQTLNLAVTSPGLNFAGVGDGDYGFIPDSAPPDTNGSVGATQYVQWVNESFAVFNKTTGALVKGPVAGNQPFQSLGPKHPCAVNNDGDPIAQYDKLAARWVLTQFSVTNGASHGYYQCVAVSESSDATGAYFVYAFPETHFNDYPKLGVWPDAYYVTFNMFNGNSFLGAKVCALDRSKMLVGDNTATQQCFQESSSVSSLLPSDLDGNNPPPSGSPNFLLTYGTNALYLYRFHVDFTNKANSTLSGPITIPVASFTPACGGGSCIPQPGTKQQLDSLADRLMYRLAYRRFSDHESLVVNHSVKTSKAASGIRWYEVRNPNSTPTLFQQGTFSPDSTSRWMGSIAMDKVGDIIVGYSASSSSVYPSILYTIQAVGDPSNTLESENSIQAGSGSQLKSLNRWGDYSSVSIDPTDDCTVFYTNEYLKTNGTFNWSTQIASFKVPSCK